MIEFDIAKPWIILAADRRSGEEAPIQATAAAELARALGVLRGNGTAPLPVLSADGPAPAEDRPVIVLNAGDEGDGFSWRAGSARVEIYGDSAKGLLNGVYDFLEALGGDWDEAGRARFPETGGAPTLRKTGAYAKAAAPFDSAAGPIPRRRADEAAVVRAARAKASVLRIAGSRGGRRPAPAAAIEAAAAFGVTLELDGPSARVLVPRRLFFFRPELFAMADGRRRIGGRFCPTNPAALRLAASRAERFFSARPRAAYYRFDPDGRGGTWCSCPACRAFTPAEQRLMAANAVAAALERVLPDARLVVETDENAEESPAAEPRRNIVRVKRREA